MKKITSVLAVGMFLLFIGCPARSLFGLFAEKDVVFNQSLVGTWLNPNEKETYTFLPWKANSYRVMIRGQKGDSAVYGAQLGRLGNFWFLDSYPAEGGDDHHKISAHLFHRMWLSGDSLTIASLESDWLKTMIETRKVAISHVQRDGDIILTAHTEELQQFLLRYAEDKEAFPSPGKLIRLK